jgi:hypothetical protein
MDFAGMGKTMQRMYTRRHIFGLFGGAAIAGAAAIATRNTLFETVAAAPATPVPGTLPADELLLRVELTGGFVPVEFLLTNRPVVSVYADGRVLTTGPMIEIYPQPALPNLRQTSLTQAGIDRVLEEARKAGLFDGSAHYDGPPVSDLPDTVFTLNANGGSTVVSAYALGVDESMLPNPADVEPRAKLIDLLTFLTDLPSRLAADEIKEGDKPFAIERLRIYTRPIDPAATPTTDPALEQPPVAWSLSTPLSEFGELQTEGPLAAGTRCAVVAGDDAKKLVESLKTANQLTPWESNGTLYAIWARPLLPDEPSSCD